MCTQPFCHVPFEYLLKWLRWIQFDTSRSDEMVESYHFKGWWLIYKTLCSIKHCWPMNKKITHSSELALLRSFDDSQLLAALFLKHVRTCPIHDASIQNGSFILIWKCMRLINNYRKWTEPLLVSAHSSYFALRKLFTFVCTSNKPTTHTHTHVQISLQQQDFVSCTFIACRCIGSSSVNLQRLFYLFVEITNKHTTLK